jgi:phospholipid/cholesterol/gamma-HCH transport system substrate-binding protein
VKRALKAHAQDFALLIGLIAVAVGVGGYILHQQGLRFPLIQAERLELKAEVIDASSVQPGQHQPVRIAFVRVGEITDVQLRDGRALLTLAIEPEYEGLIREDASALLRPKTGLEDMFLDVDPGTEDAPPAEAGHTIPISNTAEDVDSEEVLSALDGDARDYLKLLVNGAGGGLRGRASDLRQVLKRLEPLHRDLARVNGAFARQRRALARLVHNYGELTTALADEDEQLVRLVRASDAVFSATASQDTDISTAVARLPGALRQTEDTLAAVDPFADLLGPTLDRLRPSMRQLEETNPEIRDLARDTTPVVRDEIRPFVRLARPYVRDLRPTAVALRRAIPDLNASVGELNRFFNMLAHNPNGAEPVDAGGREEGYLFWLAWVAHNTNSLFSTSDASGPFRRANLSLTCTTLRELVAENPIAIDVLGVGDLISDTRLCPEDGGLPEIPLDDILEVPPLPPTPLPDPPVDPGDLPVPKEGTP